MIIGTNRKLHQNDSGELIQAHFKISGEAIEQKTYIKYLEATLIKKLNGETISTLFHLGFLGL